MFKIGDRIIVINKDSGHYNKIGKIVDFDLDNDPIVIFNNVDIKNGSVMGYGIYSDHIKLYTIDQTKKNLLD